MKKMFFLMLLISAAGIEQVNAQTGVNNNSDYHVPPPAVPQVSQSAAGSAPTVTAAPLPAPPEIPAPVSMAQNVAANSLVPIAVEVPVAPPVPTPAVTNAVTNTVGGVANVTTTGTTNVTVNVAPSIPAQLPISELPGLPTLNLEVSTPIANTITGSGGSITAGAQQPAGGGVAGGLAPEVN